MKKYIITLCAILSFALGAALPVLAAEEISRIEITTPEPEVGALAAIDEIVFLANEEVVDNENFEIDAYWYCVTDDKAMTGEAFEAEKVYRLTVNASANEGYHMSDTLSVLHNGNDGSFFSEPQKMEFFGSFSFLSPVERIELSGLSSLTAGDAPVNTLSITNGVESCDVFVMWYDENGDEVLDGTLMADHAYTVQVEVNLYGDEPISENFVYVIDGTEYAPFDVSVDTNQAWLNMEYRLSEAPAVEEGGGMPLYVAGITIAIIAVTTIAGFVVAFRSRKR